ncbi:MAG: hypothetical protein R2851_13640 [Caldilineaceae bacterium]
METFMRGFKTFTAKRIIQQAGPSSAGTGLRLHTGRKQDGAHKVWRDDFWEVVVVSDRFVRQRMNYIHRNPVRHGLVRAPEVRLFQLSKLCVRRRMAD